MKKAGSRELERKLFGKPLTEREQDIRDLTASGFTARATAEQLGISFRTVDIHRAKVFRKLGVKNAADLVCKLKDNEVQSLRQRIAELESLVETLQRKEDVRTIHQ